MILLINLYHLSHAHVRYHMRILYFCCAVEKLHLWAVEKLCLLFLVLFNTVIEYIYK